jgi:hypothetical protein
MAETKPEPTDAAQKADEGKPEFQSSLPAWHNKQLTYADQIESVEVIAGPPLGDSGVRWHLKSGHTVSPSPDFLEEENRPMGAGDYVIENEDGTIEVVDAETFEEQYSPANPGMK